MADFPKGPETRAPLRAGALVQYAGAAVSLGLILGVGVWGYRLVMRDVNGIPVVQAMEGPMRIAPTDPGGTIAAHEGLSVNAVAALGAATPPEASDMLVLAPQTVEPTEEDIAVQPTAEANEMQAIDAGPADLGEIQIAAQVAPQPAPNSNLMPAPAVTAEPTQPPEVPSIDPDKPLTNEDILALADQIAGGAAPLAPLAEGATAPVQTSVNGVSSAVIADIIPASVPGVAVSLRPLVRPASITAKATAPAAAPAAASPTVAPEAETVSAAVVSTATIPAGTSLVQLGAYDSAEIAASEWTRLSTRFSDFLAGKEQLIQEANRNGRTFFRLRAMGFADQADARRFCAALVSENADCVPVVVR